jgi:hypothetical protein
MSNTNETFFQKAFDWIKNELGIVGTEVTTIEHFISVFANKATDAIKAIQPGGAAAFLETGLKTIATAINPAFGAAFSGLELELPKILNLVSGVTAEIDKPLPNQVEDAAAKIASIAHVNPAVYAGLLTTVNTAIQHYGATNNGVVVTPANLIASAVVTHAS